MLCLMSGLRPGEFGACIYYYINTTVCYSKRSRANVKHDNDP